MKDQTVQNRVFAPGLLKAGTTGNGIGNNFLRAAIDDGQQVSPLPIELELGHVRIPLVLRVNRPKMRLIKLGLYRTLGPAVAVILTLTFTNQSK